MLVGHPSLEVLCQVALQFLLLFLSGRLFQQYFPELLEFICLFFYHIGQLRPCIMDMKRV